MCVCVCVVLRFPHTWAETGQGSPKGSLAMVLMVCEVSARQGRPTPESQAQGWDRARHYLRMPAFV